MKGSKGGRNDDCQWVGEAWRGRMPVIGKSGEVGDSDYVTWSVFECVCVRERERAHTQTHTFLCVSCVCVCVCVCVCFFVLLFAFQRAHVSVRHL
jgi:hypothetical protein